MRNKKKLSQMFIVLMIFILATSGCGLAPKEEVLPDAPVLPIASIKQYKKATVMRGDIIQRVKVDCTYKAFMTDELKFGVDGKRIAHVYVEEGDKVRAGDLLADLQMKDLTDQIKVRSDNIEVINMNIANEKELMDLAINTLNKLRNMEGYTLQMGSRYEAEIARREDSIRNYEEDLYFEQQRLDKLNEEVKKHQIFAGIDGVILNIKEFHWRSVSNTEDKVITIYDPDTMVFVTSGKNPELFKVGQEVTVKVDKNEYKTTVIDPEEFNKEIEADQDSGVVYLKVTGNDQKPHNDAIGEIIFTLKELKNVLYLPSTAVRTDNGRSIVYVEDEGGFKSIKEVETGFNADRRVEIISGLNEGDNVILE